ncbi:MAG TPA: DUF6531 domain-containing protein, partial [Trebonia sp.]|nr:DUF6531 domain-containing protein [Trebonia sp.]
MFQNADGSYTQKIYASPVNYQTSSGSWAPIDETLAQGTGGRWQETANSPAVSFATTGNDKALGTLASADGSESASFSLTGAGDVIGSASGPSVTYAGILPDTDLTQTGTATGIGESLTLSSASASASWVLPLTLKGLTASLDGGSVDLTDSAGNVVWVIGPATISSGTANAPVPGSQAPSQPAWQLVTSGGAPALEMTLDSSWLDAPGRVFPVTADWSVSAATPGSTYAESENGTSETADNGGSALLPSGTTTNSDGTSKNIDFLSFPPLGGWPTGEHVVTASLNLFDVYAAQCSAATSVSAYQVTGARPGRGPLTYPGPSYGTQDAQWTGTAPSAACSNKTGDPGQGGWLSLQFGDAGLSLLNSGAAAGTAFAVTPSQTDAQSFKQFASANAASAPASAITGSASTASTNATLSATAASVLTAATAASVPDITGSTEPYLEVTATTETPPQIDSQYPPDNYNSPTLTPELLASGQDYNGATLQYKFSIYSSAGSPLANSGLITTGYWTVPAGDLAWGQSYYWTVQDYDGTDYSATPPAYFFSTPVPQPLITSGLSQNGSGPGFDAQTGDWTTSATDADVATVGPALEITRDYNSEDPRLSGAFGAGWSSVLDMKVSPGQASGSGTTATQIVTYPDGEDVAFGLISAGGTTYAAPSGRYATLTAISGGFTLTDKNDTVYTFTQSLGSSVYGITSIADAFGRTETFTYNASNQITTITSASGRTLTITWTSPSGAVYQHVASVVTNDATAGNSSTAQDWTYTYSGDELSTACPPASTTACTAYSYTSGSDYPAAVLDSGPQSYWRLDETSGTTAASSVLLNEGADDATYSGTSLGSVSGPLAGSAATSAGFNGASSYVSLPSRLGRAGYEAVGMWFKTTTAGGVLYAYSTNPLSSGEVLPHAVPGLYVGVNGELYGEFYEGSASSALHTSFAVDDGNW